MKTTKMKPSELVEIKGWCQGVSSRNKDGIPIPLYDYDVVSFCALAAVERCYAASDFDNYRNTLAMLIGYQSITTWNDDPNRTKEEVINKLKEVEQHLGLE